MNGFTLEPVDDVKFRLVDEEGTVWGYVWPSVKDRGRWKMSWSQEVDKRMASREIAVAALVGMVHAVTGGPEIPAGERSTIFQPFKLSITPEIIADALNGSDGDLAEIVKRNKWALDIRTPSEAQLVHSALEAATRRSNPPLPTTRQRAVVRYMKAIEEKMG